MVNTLFCCGDRILYVMNFSFLIGETIQSYLSKSVLDKIFMCCLFYAFSEKAQGDPWSVSCFSIYKFSVSHIYF